MIESDWNSPIHSLSEFGFGGSSGGNIKYQPSQEGKRVDCALCFVHGKIYKHEETVEWDFIENSPLHSDCKLKLKFN